MALSKADQEFYDEKLNWKSIAILFGATGLLGTLLFPVVTYLQVGDAKTFTVNIAADLAIAGFLFGSMVAFVMYVVFKFLLVMGWLPSRQ